MGPRLDRGQRRLQALGRNVLDIRFASLNRGDLPFVNVDRDHVLAGFGKGDGERQPDVAESDHTNVHGRRLLVGPWRFILTKNGTQASALAPGVFDASR